MTYGQDAVGLTFNPGQNPDVHSMKAKFADIVDELYAIRENEEFDPEKRRLAAIAITEAQGAQMWAVKAITWKT